jgi:diaminohydroxyphosphoribosylaminopyrimidine deaminase/5-amino-6-(5-phosphoribosylamino)uracil reductase
MATSVPMRAALDAALTVRGATSPNPWVGAAVVREGTIVAVGATEPPPGRHAEAVALEQAGERARGADLYVTLEPCAPFAGKRTQPCAVRAVEAGIARVVVALEDPDPNVAGRGIALLREAGIEVALGDGRDEAIRILRPYLKHRLTGTPYVIAKFAASLDGRTATASGDSRWITGEAARALVHEQRAWVDAIIAGSGTIIADDPELTARPGRIPTARQPLRVVLDARGRIPPGARLFSRPGPILVATTPASGRAWRQEIAAIGAEVLVAEPGVPAGVNLHQLLQALGARGVLSAWVEGGATVLGALFDLDLVDELWAFLAPIVIGGTRSVPAIAGTGAATIAEAWRLIDPVVELPGTDVLVRGYLRPLPLS